VLTRIANQFDLHPELAALFGSYDASPTALQLVSQYRNLHHHFIHQDQSQNATTFWAGCGAIRRDVFHAVGGFNVEFTRPCIEDIELGIRLAKQGYNIRLDRDMLVTHAKRWTMMNMIATDVRDRAVPWTRLIVAERSMPRGLNLHWSQQLSAVLTWLMLLVLVCQVFSSPWAVGLACVVLPLIAVLDPLTARRGWKHVVEVCVAFAIFVVPVSMAIRAPVAAALFVTIAGMVIWLNRRFYRFLVSHRGFAFASCCLPLHLLYYVYASLTFACEFCRFRLGSRRQRKPEPQGAEPCR
jgi:hypothetical protein